MIFISTYATFSGINPSKFKFKNFIAQFNNYPNLINLNKSKLTLLKGYLTGDAQQRVSYLAMEDDKK